MGKQPNIVFVLTDDQGYGDLSCTGNPVLRTPCIDHLHAQSVRFTDYHVGPTCAPTRAGLMTGHYHNSTGVWHTIGGRSLLRKNEWTLPQALREAGYATGIFGKWHLGDNYPYRPHDRGFDEAIVHGGGGVGQTPDYWENDYFDDTYFDRGVPRKFEGYCTDVFFSLARHFIARHKDRPFFCYIPTNAPHMPYQVPQAYADAYRDQVREERARFMGMIACIDENVGRMRSFLAEQGLADNTIFIYMTDNGTSGGADISHLSQHVTEGYNAGMRGIKGSAYEGGHRTPFFLHDPRRENLMGRDISELTANVDVMPTLLDLAGAPVSAERAFDGMSLTPLIEGKPFPGGGRIMVTDSQRVPDPVKWKDSATMRGPWRLINGKALYNIAADPGQRTDVAELHPQMVQELRAGYEAWWMHVSAHFQEEIPISIGSDREKLTNICAHDWRGSDAEVAWNQGQIRAARVCNSYVEIFVEQAGRYRFELRRWPSETGLALDAGIRGELYGWFSGGVSLALRTACIRVGDFSAEAPVQQGQQSAVFEADLPAGGCHLQTCLVDAQGVERGAYYVYVQRL